MAPDFRQIMANAPTSRSADGLHPPNPSGTSHRSRTQGPRGLLQAVNKVHRRLRNQVEPHRPHGANPSNAMDRPLVLPRSSARFAPNDWVASAEAAQIENRSTPARAPLAQGRRRRHLRQAHASSTLRPASAVHRAAIDAKLARCKRRPATSPPHRAACASRRRKRRWTTARTRRVARTKTKAPGHRPGA